MSDTDTVDDFAGKISGLAAQSASLGETIDETKLVKKFLKGLPRNKFIHIVASLEQVLDLSATGFEDIVGRLKAYEERVREETQSEDQSKLMFSNSNNNRGAFGNFRGGNRGSFNRGGYNRGGSNRGGYNRGGFNRGRGRGRTNWQTQEGETGDHKTKKDLSKIICWRCDKAGHYASTCHEKAAGRQETNLHETQEAEALYVHEVVFLNEDKVFPNKYVTNNESVWYLDNGASNHMTGNKEFFSSLDENIQGKVKFGDGSYVNIIGKGSIVFVGKTGERRTLKEIYFIPDLKHNIISLGQATENGCEVNMKGDVLALRDPHGMLLV